MSSFSSDRRLEEMICQLIDFYEISGGYEDFYEKELPFRTPEQIAALFEETFGNQLL